MDSRLAVSSNRPSFTAITTVKNPAKLLTEAEVKFIKEQGAKLGNNKTDTLDIVVVKSQKHPDEAYNFSYAATSTKKGQVIPDLSTSMKVIPFSKMSPIDMVKRTLSRLKNFYNA